LQRARAAHRRRLFCARKIVAILRGFCGLFCKAARNASALFSRRWCPGSNGMKER